MVSLSRVASDVILGLNAGPPGSYGATTTDPRWNATQITDAVLTADAMVCAAYFRNRENSRSYLFYVTQTGLAHGGTIGDNIAGPIASVKFNVTGGSAPGPRPGILWDEAEIQREIADPLSLDFDPHYATDGKVIWHNGAAIAVASGGGTVSVDLVFPAFTRSSACQAPDESEYVVFCGAMSMLVPVEGENSGYSGSTSEWGRNFQAGLQAIASGEGSIPTQVREQLQGQQGVNPLLLQ